MARFAYWNGTNQRGSDSASSSARRTAPFELAESDPRWFVPFQYANLANPRAHYEGTGAEIADALDRVDVLVAGLGTGGTLMGAGDVDDGGWKYLSADFWEAPSEDVAESMESTVWW